MAFHFFLSLLPLFVFIGYVLGGIVQKRGTDAVLGVFFDSIPAASEVLVKKEAERLAGASTLGPLGAIGFLWLASGGTHGLMVALEGVIGAPRRPWWKKRAIAFAWVLGTVGALTIASWALVEWDTVVQPAVETRVSQGAAPRRTDAEVSVSAKSSASSATPVRRRPGRLRTRGHGVLALAISLSFAIVGLAGFYRFSISHQGRLKRRVFPGAFLAVTLGLIISWVFGLYVRTLASYAVYYGSLAAVAVLLVWLWLVSLVILAGAELNSQLEGLRDHAGALARPETTRVHPM